MYNMDLADIKDFLSKYNNRSIVYIPNPGNAGDSLIAQGTVQLFDDLRLNWSMGEIGKTYKGETLFYAGGGNLVGLYGNCRDFLKRNKDHNQIVILPHTIKSEDAFLSKLNNNVIIFCRERTSYEYVLSVFKHRENVYLSKDMAFYIEGIETYKATIGRGVCNAYRLDCEKTNIAIPRGNIDLSNALNKSKNTCDKNVITEVSHSVFAHISKYEVINTNRLHIAIAGALLGKKVNFSPNIYYKNQAVFEYSIQNVYSNVTFMVN